MVEDKLLVKGSQQGQYFKFHLVERHYHDGFNAPTSISLLSAMASVLAKKLHLH